MFEVCVMASSPWLSPPACLCLLHHVLRQALNLIVRQTRPKCALPLQQTSAIGMRHAAPWEDDSLSDSL